MRRRKTDHWLVRNQVPFAHTHTHRGMRVQHISLFLMVSPDRSQGIARVTGGRFKQFVFTRIAVRTSRDGKLFHPGPQTLRVFAHPIVQVAFEVAGNLDIHRRAQRGLHAAARILTRLEEAGQDIVFVCGQHEPTDGKAHTRGEVSRKNIAEVAGRHRETHFPGTCLLHGAKRRVKVVHHLCEQAGPVDRVHCAKLEPILECQVPENILHDALAVIERPLNGQGVDIRIRDRCHLQLLDAAGSSVWIQDEHAHVIPPSQAVDRGTPRIAAGGPKHIQLTPGLLQEVLEQVAEQLQGNVLERQCRAMKQLKNVQIPHRYQGRDLCMPERAVTAVDPVGQLIVRHICVQADNLMRQLKVGQRPPGR